MTNRQPDEERIFHVAREISKPEARSEYLNQICAGDQALRERVEALLEVHEQDEDFLKSADEPPPTLYHPAPTERPGATIGRYKLMEQIGEGGMGTVFVAQQERPIRRKAALKVIKPGMDSKAVVARFEAERQALAMMDHSNISKVLDAGTTESGRPYFAMELVKGIPITEYCDKNKLTVRERLGLFTQVCQAIQHAHQKGIIHRDIKPSNVLVTLHDGKPVPKVIDFGVAKALNTRLTDKTIYTEHMQIIGTLMYMSPEQAEMSGLDVDTRSDIYGLGVLLYELLTGTTPFQKADLDQAGFDEQRRIIRETDPPRASQRISSLGETATSIAEHRKTDARKLHQQVRGDLDWIVMKALEKDRTRRYATASAFATEVDRFLGDQPVEARPPSSSYRLKKLVRRNKVPVAVGVTIILAVTTAVLGISLGLVQARRNADDLRKTLADRDKILGDLRRTLADRDRILGDLRRTLADRDRILAKHDRILDDLQGKQFDEALAAVFGRDEQVAQQEIGEAAEMEVAESKLEMLRGLACMFRGSDEATSHLEHAVELDESSYAARGALAWAYAGDPDSYTQAFLELESLTPVSAEDFLFKALHEQASDPAEALKSIQEAIRLRDSPLARVIRAAALVNNAVLTLDLDEADEAIDETRAAQKFIPANNLALGIELGAHHAARRIAKFTDEDAKADRYLVEAETLAGQIPDRGDASVVRYWFLADTGRVDVVLREWEAEFRRGKRTSELYYVAPWFFMCREPDKFLTLSENAPDRDGPFTKLARAFLVIEHEDKHDKLRRISKELISQDTPVDVCLGALELLLLLGEHEEAVEQAKLVMANSAPPARSPQVEWGEHVEFIAGEPREKYLEKVPFGAHYRIGLVMLAQGRKKEAQKHFVEQTKGPVYDLSYWWAKAFLERMDSDPHWPRWIPNGAGAVTTESNSLE